MILFIILAIILIGLLLFGILIAGAGGVIGTILLSDLIVCGFIIVLIMRWLIKRKKK